MLLSSNLTSQGISRSQLINRYYTALILALNNILPIINFFSVFAVHVPFVEIESQDSIMVFLYKIFFCVFLFTNSYVI